MYLNDFRRPLRGQEVIAQKIYSTRSHYLTILDYKKPICFQYFHPRPPPQPLISRGH